MTASSRRHFVVQSLCGCVLSAAGVPLSARIPPSEVTPLISAGYKPVDADERGLWQEFDKLEDKLAASHFLIRDEALTQYVVRVTQRLLGAVAADLRIYIVRDPDFNASMAPNGMMIVHTGLLARMRNEAQFAALLGHESGHYLMRHSVRKWRDSRSKSAVVTALTMAGEAALFGNPLRGYLSQGINRGLLLLLFSFSREMESEADALGLKLLHDAGYDADAAAQVWEQFLEERVTSAAARDMPFRDGSQSAMSTHPPTIARMVDLGESAAELQKMSGVVAHYNHGRQEWMHAIERIRPMLIDEQVKLNDPGASLYLINTLARDGWDGVLRYYEGEAYRLRNADGDVTRAAEAYAAAVEHPNAPAEAHRAHGYAQLKAGQTEQGRSALTRYLELYPSAPDAAMVRYTLSH